MRDVLVFSCEPGGAEVLVPVVRLLSGEYRVTVAAYGHGRVRFGERGVETAEIAPVGKGDRRAIDRFRPDFIITSATSLVRDMSEKHLWESAREVGIPTLAFLDQWQNYAGRFSGPTAEERLSYLPDHINCINDLGEREMLREGFDPAALVKFGHPSLAEVKERAAALDPQRIRERLGIPADRKIFLFASEAIREHCGRSRGYDQYDALRLFLRLAAASPLRPVPLIKLHPKDEAAHFQAILEEFSTLAPRVATLDPNALECIAVAEEVYGMTSVMLVEAHLLGKRAVSLQPGLVVEDPLVLTRHGMIPRIDGTERDEGRHPAHPPLEIDFKAQELMAFLRKRMAHAEAGTDESGHKRGI